MMNVAKVNDELGIVIGWAIVSKVDGEEYFDSQGDHISESVMLDACADFMQHGRNIAKDMHEGPAIGRVVFAFPMTGDIAQSLGIQTKQTGLIIGIKPNDPAILEKYRAGIYRGFSIGGKGERHAA